MASSSSIFAVSGGPLASHTSYPRAAWHPSPSQCAVVIFSCFMFLHCSLPPSSMCSISEGKDSLPDRVAMAPCT